MLTEQQYGILLGIFRENLRERVTTYAEIYETPLPEPSAPPQHVLDEVKVLVYCINSGSVRG